MMPLPLYTITEMKTPIIINWITDFKFDFFIMTKNRRIKKGAENTKTVYLTKPPKNRLAETKIISLNKMKADFKILKIK